MAFQQAQEGTPAEYTSSSCLPCRWAVSEIHKRVDLSPSPPAWRCPGSSERPREEERGGEPGLCSAGISVSVTDLALSGPRWLCGFLTLCRGDPRGTHRVLSAFH